jgi:hypothetical protein
MTLLARTAVTVEASRARLARAWPIFRRLRDVRTFAAYPSHSLILLSGQPPLAP